jgi:hypothetical protein
MVSKKHTTRRVVSAMEEMWKGYQNCMVERLECWVGGLTGRVRDDCTETPIQIFFHPSNQQDALGILHKILI